MQIHVHTLHTCLHGVILVYTQGKASLICSPALLLALPFLQQQPVSIADQQSKCCIAGITYDNITAHTPFIVFMSDFLVIQLVTPYRFLLFRKFGFSFSLPLLTETIITSWVWPQMHSWKKVSESAVSQIIRYLTKSQ